MPSDSRHAAALEAVAGSRERFRSNVARTIEEVRGLIAARDSSTEDRGARLAEELGSFADGWIDASRLAEVLVEPHRVGTTEVGQIERALDVLVSLQKTGDEAFVSRLESRGSLALHVGRELSLLGRAFGAARVIERVRDGLYRGGDHALLDGVPFERWNRAEREMAPPLVVELDGGDLQTGGLIDLLDGAVRLVLIVNGEAPPAAVAKLITPGVTIVQTDDPGELARISDAEGPALAALLPEGAPRIVHEPSAGPGPGTLLVERLPESPPDRPIGRASVFRQAEDLRQLRALASPEAGAAAPTGAAPGATAGLDPAGTLAAWLLGQADVSDLGSAAG